MATTVTHPFTVSGDYTFDATTVEVTGGAGQLLSRRSASSLFMANYNSSTTANWATGSTTPTVATGSPTATGGFLVLDDTERLTYPAASNFGTQTGCVVAKIKPAYTGSPGTMQTFWELKPSSGNANRARLVHETNGNFTFDLWDSGGNNIVTCLHSFSPTSGTEYHVEANFDGTTGASRLFLNGTQVGSTDTSTFTRAAASTETISIGSSTVAQAFSLNWLEVFNAVQHTANFTPAAEPADTIYSTSNDTITTINTVTGGLLSFTASTTASGSDAVKFVLRVGGTDKWWNGSAWATSSSYSESNTASDINANLESLDTGISAVAVKVYLHSDAGTTTPTVDIVTIQYIVGDSSATEPTLAFVQGYLYDHNGPLASVVVYIKPTEGFLNEEIFISHDWLALDTTDSSGYFSGYMWESASVGKTYDFKFGTKRFRGAIPDSDDVKFYDLELTALTND